MLERVIPVKFKAIHGGKVSLNPCCVGKGDSNLEAAEEEYENVLILVVLERVIP